MRTILLIIFLYLFLRSSISLGCVGEDTMLAGIEEPEQEGQEWQLVWADEFNGCELDQTKWEHEVNCWGGGNSELACYTSRRQNSYLADGKLNIVAYREEWTGPDGPEGDGPPKTLPYTSARIRSKNLADFRYGKFCAVARLPHGQGTWPAFWLLPTHNAYGGWSASGELDVMEAVNLPGDPRARTTVHGTLWFGRPSPEQQKKSAAYMMQKNAAFGFHEYCVEWHEWYISWFVDGYNYLTIDHKDWWTSGSSDPRAPYDQDFHIILNLAIGGDWPGSPDPQTVFPQRFVIDSVRVYKKYAIVIDQ